MLANLNPSHPESVIKRDHIFTLVIVSILTFLFIVNVYAEDIEYIDRELILNGGFEMSVADGWLGRGDPKPEAAYSGEKGFDLSSYLENNAVDYIFQVLAVPSELASVSLRFHYRAAYDELADFNTNMPDKGEYYIPIDFEVLIEKGDTPSLEQERVHNVAEISSETFDAPTEWMEFTIDLDQNQMALMEESRNDGNWLFLYFLQRSQDSSRRNLTIYLDDVSMRVNGVQRVPELKGEIAYVDLQGTDPQHPGRPTINIIDPVDRAVRTIWTNPADDSNLAFARWKPDGSRIAFSSNFDRIFSPFDGDIYTIKPDGTDLAKVTCPPSTKEMENGDYPRVTLQGNIINTAGANVGDIYALILCVQGARECIGLNLAGNDNMSFTIPDVAVLGDPQEFAQPMTIYWNTGVCTRGVEWKLLTGKVVDGSVSLDPVAFAAMGCQQWPNLLYPFDLAWTADGAAINTTMRFGSFQFDAVTGQPLMGEKMPIDSPYAGNLEWSPVDDRYLYTDFYDSEKSFNHDIVLGREGSEPQLLVENVELIAPAWLKDGSGFIFVHNDEDIYSYDFDSGAIRRLTYFNDHIKEISVSPDNAYILFEKCTGNTHCDLWVVARENPTEVWPLHEEGACRYADWSWGDATPDRSQQSAGETSGGCFISLIQSVP